MKYYFCLALAATVLFASSCGDETDRFEVVAKLRALGMQADQPIVSGASTVNLEIFALIPTGQLVTSAEVFVDPQAPEGFALSLQLNDGEVYEDHGALQLYRKTASLLVPAVNEAVLQRSNGVARFRYGVKLKGNGEEETIVGDILSVSAGSSSLLWKTSAVSLVAPDGVAPIAMPFSLNATLDRPQEERVKISWLISSGKLENSGGLETSWEESEKGIQTVVIAAYSTKSRFFSYQIRQVTVE